MMSALRLILVLLALAGFVEIVGAQELSRSCLSGSDNGEGLSLRVDATGAVHMARLALVSGNLLYTKLEHGAEAQNTIVARRVSLYPADSVAQTDLLLHDGVPYICYRDARQGAMKVAHLAAGQWALDTVVAEDGLGDGCALYWQNGSLHLVFQGRDGIRMGHKNENEPWRFDDVDLTAGAGESLSVMAFTGGRVTVAYSSGVAGGLRVATKDPGAPWRTALVEFPVPAGEGVRIVGGAAGHVWIIHGVRGDAGSDAGLIITYGRPDSMESVYLRNEYIGGSIGAARLAGQQLGVFTREQRRSAVFGDYDALRYYDVLPAFAEYSVMEQHDSHQVRHRFSNIDLAADPFGLPVCAFVDEVAPSPGQPGAAPVCLYRPTDTDGDKLPDRVEAWLGSDPENPDTDGDGVSDGDEALRGDHPVRDGPLPEGVLLGDAEGPVFRPPDQRDAGMGVELDGGLDATIHDAGELDVDRGPESNDSGIQVQPDNGEGVSLGPEDLSLPDRAMGDRSDGTVQGDAAMVQKPLADGGCSSMPWGPQPPGWWSLFLLWGLACRRNSGYLRSKER